MPDLLHPALRLLLRTQLKARWRKLTRGAGTLKGKLRLAGMLAVFGLGFSPLAFAAIFREPVDDPSGARAMVASGLFLLTMLTVIGQGADAGVAFAPAEVDLLFPAPFSRRDLLVYRLVTLALGALFSALFFSLVSLTYAEHWIFAFLGFALAIQFMQLTAMTLGLTVSIVGQAAYTRGRKAGLIVVGALALIGVIQTGSFSLEQGTGNWVHRFGETTVGAVMLAPTHVFARAITARQFLPDFAGWFLLALVADAALVALVLRLDANFLERSVATSQKVYLRLQRLRAGQGWMNLARPTAVRWRLPMPARWRGAGPIAWRQMVAAVRGSRGIVYFVVIVAVLMGFAMASMPELSISGFAFGFFPMMAITLLPQMLRFDFRSDFDCFDALKTLPASAWAIAAGELVAPTLFATALEFPCILVVGVASGELRAALTVMAFMPGLNLLIFALENLIFLWYPQRLTNAAELSGMSRRMLTGMAKFFIIAAVAGISAGAGAAVYWIFGQAWAPALVASWIVVTSCALLVIPLVARAFERLDVSAIPLD
jgi:hypothetical protein